MKTVKVVIKAFRSFDDQHGRNSQWHELSKLREAVEHAGWEMEVVLDHVSDGPALPYPEAIGVTGI